MVAVDEKRVGRVGGVLSAPGRVWAFVGLVPVWAWLTGLVVVSTGIRYVFTRHAVAPWIMVDELIYSELAKSFAASGHFLVRDHSTGGYGYVYPVLIAPAWAAFKAIPDAYAAAKGINSLVMSLAAVPAYFLARRVLGKWLSLAAAALAVAIPSMVYTATLMTENAFYPVFLTVVLVFVAWLERPTLTSTALLGALVLIAYLTRAQAIALIPAILTAPLIIYGRDGFRRYRPAYLATTVAAVLVAVVQAARGASVFGIFGAYKVATGSNYSAGEVTRYFLYHISELDLSVGVLPFAALLVLAVAVRRLPRPQQAFVAASVALTFWLVLEVAAFASEQSFAIEERNMFYLAPLMLIALLVWIERASPRGTVWATAAIMVAAALPGALPYPSFIGLKAISDTIALLPLGWLVDQGLGLDDVGLVVVLASAVAGLLFLLIPRRYLIALPLLVLVYFAVSQASITAKHQHQSLESLLGGIVNPNRDWIDRAVGSGANVAVVWTGHTDKFTIWENEFFNRSVGTIYATGPPLPGDLAETEVTVSNSTGELLTPTGHRVHARYALTDSSLALNGTVIARDIRKGMNLYRLNGPLRQVAQITGVYADKWSGRQVTYARVDCDGGTLAVTLQGDPNLFKRPNVVDAAEGGQIVASTLVPVTGQTVLRVPLRPIAHRCVTRFTVEHTAVPTVILGPTTTDTRTLGTHFTAFTYRTP